MSKRFPRAKWVLPDVINPPDRICYTISVPNERAHVGAFLGAIYNLTSAIFWSDDDAHTAKEVALVWRDIFDAMVKGSCDIPHDIKNSYGDFEEMPRFKDKCEHDLFYIGCDDTEHKIAFTSDIPAGGSPSTGSPQPAPGGGQQNYCQTLLANQQMFIPTLINSGDTIELVSAAGSWWDGGEQSLGFPIWRCPDGEQFVAGVCTGPTTETITGADPVVGAAHMSLIVYIGATAYSLESGPVTVPGGVVNGNAVVQVNDSAIANNQGSADVCIKVTNNQTGTFSHTFDFRGSPGGWSPSSSNSIWVAGLGWGAIVDENWIEIACPRTITGVTYAYTWDNQCPGAGAADALFYDTVSGPTRLMLNALASPGATRVWIGSQAVAKVIVANNDNIGGGCTPTGHTTIITSVTITGIGSDPF